MNSPPLQPLELALARAWPAGLWGQVRVLVAVSGGADSVALLRAMQRLWSPALGELIVAHFNHHLRVSADRDEQFVVALAAQKKLRCEVGHADPDAATGTPDGVEAAARLARYTFLRQTAERLGARYVVTAHTADDQAETILHHIVRGTGLAGLAGMRRVRVLSPAVTLMRPLLDLRREDIIKYLDTFGQAYCQDETNLDRNFTRNRIRHELLPLLRRDYSASIDASLLRLGSVAAEAQHVIERLAAEQLDAALVAVRPEVVIDCGRLHAVDRHVVRELFVALWRRQDWSRQAMGFEQWDALAEMTRADNPAPTPLMLPGAIRAQKTGEQLVLARLG